MGKDCESKHSTTAVLCSRSLVLLQAKCPMSAPTCAALATVTGGKHDKVAALAVTIELSSRQVEASTAPQLRTSMLRRLGGPGSCQLSSAGQLRLKELSERSVKSSTKSAQRRNEGKQVRLGYEWIECYSVSVIADAEIGVEARAPLPLGTQWF
ncbi:hypothetical protein GE21DRAFT_296 [Neurospora crassa]|uniref:Uncharacterized protein n=1 Tax=Neurospora crassa (strain ATCC 24698 / 74-OR23-1A / CBS 708.71 / DSM 1257 / FGSC 987) TaxID=367110 RepID=Q7SE46_NEUCR|nr:hypothetical protein NCU02129 [Neurospora crassa OR74A]EAA35051.3 hypothetical protein NCU02129 [Neurospora crassa OR74A]KHE83929.1 hypothetical protein GE21DRAFT_296 [Neurospora crassa]|eukprot:XP_964287.3 hypothetical protein NCU02129 [Neurospora crassa OR74A]